MENAQVENESPTTIHHCGLEGTPPLIITPSIDATGNFPRDHHQFTPLRSYSWNFLEIVWPGIVISTSE
jgi:hypothetical protein